VYLGIVLAAPVERLSSVDAALRRMPVSAGSDKELRLRYLALPNVCVTIDTDDGYQRQLQLPLISPRRTVTSFYPRAPARGAAEEIARCWPCTMDSRVTAGSVPGQSQLQRFQPWVIPQWPSMLKDRSQTAAQSTLECIRSGQSTLPCTLQSPIFLLSKRTTLTPRRKLTDSERKKICQYAEKHPTRNQKQIGGS